MNANSRSDGPYSRNTMRVLGVMTAIGGALFLLWGVMRIIDGKPGGGTLLAVGAVCAAVAAVGIPFAIRRGRM